MARGGKRLCVDFRTNPPVATTDLSPSSQNKTASAVQLKHIPTGTVIKSQDTRSQSQNRKIARRLLADKIEAAEKGPESRLVLKAAIERKKKASKRKKAKRKYKALKDEAEDEEEEAENDSDRFVQEKAKEERV